ATPHRHLQSFPTRRSSDLTLKRELAWLRRGARARSTKQRARIERIDTLKEQTFQTKKEQVEFQVGASRLGKQVIELQDVGKSYRSEEHTSELQSRFDLVCR